MTGSIAVDLVIGLIFIYLLYSLLGSLILEILATNLGFRAKILEKSIGKMLDEDISSRYRLKTWLRLLTPLKISLLKKDGFSGAFYEHPEIKLKSEDKLYSKPSFFEANNFSKVVIDLLKGQQTDTGDEVRNRIDIALKKGYFTKFDNSVSTKIDNTNCMYLKSLWQDSQGDVIEFKRLLEKWFNQMMERTTGWYKKYNQIVLLFIGFFLAITFNVDTIVIAKKLSKDQKLRSSIVSQADAFMNAYPSLSRELTAELQIISTDSNTNKSARTNLAINEYNKILERRDSLVKITEELIKSDIADVNNLLSLGWKKQTDNNGKKCIIPKPNGANTIIGRIAGWFLTALAISLGAPFWFDLLNKIMKFRASLKTGSSIPEKTSRETDQQVKRVG